MKTPTIHSSGWSTALHRYTGQDLGIDKEPDYI